jgi:hypothetical protein
MDIVCRDYVYSWYRKLGSSQEFPVEVRTTLARVLSILAEKMGEVSNVSSDSSADPGSLFRIPDPNFFHPGSEFLSCWIPDPHQRI